MTKPDTVEVPRETLEFLVSLAEKGQNDHDHAEYSCWGVKVELSKFL